MHLHGVIERAVVDICANLDEDRGDIEAIVHNRDVHRRGAVAIGEIQIGFAGSEASHRRFVTVTRGPHQCGEAAGRMIRVLAFGERRDVRFQIGIRARFEQGIDDSRMTFGSSPHQRGFTLKRIRGVDIDSASEQQVHAFDAACA